MPDRDTDLIEKIVGQRLADIATELKHLNDLLETFKAATQKEMSTLDTHLTNVQAVQRALPLGVPRYLSGRWPLRDGDTYGSIAPQPILAAPAAEPEINANSPTGHLRSTDER